MKHDCSTCDTSGRCTYVCEGKKGSSWDSYFLNIAQLIAGKSKDTSTKVGCVVVGPDNEIRATGYNGLPRGVDDDRPERFERPAKYLWTSHAEENAVAQAARVGMRLKGCKAYVTHYPCARCTRSLIQAGIVCIVVGNGQVKGDFADDLRVSQAMLQEARVEVHYV